MPVEISRKYNPKTNLCDIVEYSQCPFGIRDLQNDNCYDGNGKNKCQYFVRYDFTSGTVCVVCNHKKVEQLELFQIEVEE